MCEVWVCWEIFSLPNVHLIHTLRQFHLIISAVDQRGNVKMQAQAKFKSQCEIDASASFAHSLFKHSNAKMMCDLCFECVCARTKNRTLKRARYFSHVQTNESKKRSMNQPQNSKKKLSYTHTHKHWELETNESYSRTHVHSTCYTCTELSVCVRVAHINQSLSLLKGIN